VVVIDATTSAVMTSPAEFRSVRVTVKQVGKERGFPILVSTAKLLLFYDCLRRFGEFLKRQVWTAGLLEFSCEPLLPMKGMRQGLGPGAPQSDTVQRLFNRQVGVNSWSIISGQQLRALRNISVGRAFKNLLNGGDCNRVSFEINCLYRRSARCRGAGRQVNL
jgi:hypothetical protein